MAATLRAFVLPVLYIVSPTLYVSKYLWEVRNVSGESMSPFLSPDYHVYGRKDTVLIRKSVQLADEPVAEGGSGRRSELERGMIVVFRTPWKPESTAVKRIVALEGDTVRLVKRRAYTIAARGGAGVNAGEFAAARQKKTQKERKGQDTSMAAAAANEKEDNEDTFVTVPFGHVWVEGEGGVRTLDSNDYGPISKSLIQGVVEKVLLPRKRFGDLKWREAWQQKCASRVTVNANNNNEIPEEWAM